jgi:ADP-heptose:LPS heptosyltransferase
MKVLVVRFSSIGDIVLTTPVVRCLKQQIPNAEIHYLTKQKFRVILAENPYIDTLHTIEKSIDELLPKLKSIGFDIVIDLHSNLRTRTLAWKLGVKTHRFPKLNIQKWMYVNFKVNRMPDVHIVERYFEAVKSLGVTNDMLPCDYYIAQQDILDIEETLHLQPNSYVAFAMGAQFATKRLPNHKIREICEKISLPVVLLGGPEDAENGAEIQKDLTHVYNGCGLFTLGQSASIVKQAKTVIAHDTGLMHIASAFEKHIVSIWGNTTPSIGMYPYMPRNNNFSIHEVPNLACRPCSKIGFKACPKKHFVCMEKQDIEAIVKSVMA